jgi:hypothetical protein
MSNGGFTSFPDHPLADADIRAIDQHATLDFCISVYRLAADTDANVVITIGKEDRIHLLCYNPEDQQWERIDTIDRPESIAEEIPFDEDELSDQVLRHYDEEDLESAGYSDNPFLGLIKQLPEEPLTDEYLDMIQNRQPVLAGIIPLVRRQSDKRVIAAIFIFEDVIERQRIIAALGYEPDEGNWQLFSSVEGSDPNRTKALERLEVTYAQWVRNRYSLDEIHIIENPEEAFES